MAIYSISRNATVTTSGSATSDIGVSTGVRPRILEINAFLAAATASTYAINRTTALGTRTTPVALNSEDPADPTLTGITLVDSAVAWSVQPTLGGSDLRSVVLPATIGAGMIWTFPRGLVLAVSLSIAVVNRATNSANSWVGYSADI